MPPSCLFLNPRSSRRICASARLIFAGISSGMLSFWVLSSVGLGQVLPPVPPRASGEFFQEVPLANEAELTRKAVDHSVELARKSRTDGMTRRDAHAKHHGCIKGKFQVHSDIPEIAQFGIFRPGRLYPVWARLSNAMPRPLSDRIPDARGLALKLMGVEGPKLLSNDPEKRTQDFLLASNPVFMVPNLKEYNALLANPGGYLLTHPRAALLTAQTVAKTVSDPLVFRYWSMTPAKLGPRAAKFRAQPCAGAVASKGQGSNFLSDAMENHLSEREGCFEFAVQFQNDEKLMPVEDPSVEWNEEMSPFIPVAKVTFPVQSFSSAAQNDFCEDLSFTPWHSLVEHRPLGNLSRARKAVYEAVSVARHLDNATVRKEPDGSENF